MVEDLKTSNIGQWYSKVKWMSQIDPTTDEKVSVSELMDVPSQTQAELILDNFSEISHLYQPLKSEDIQIPSLETQSQCPSLNLARCMRKLRKWGRKHLLYVGTYLGKL
jgi:hypothetical protein